MFTYLVRTFEKLGWRFARQSASHIILVKEGEMVTLSVPDHHEVAKGSDTNCWVNSRRIYCQCLNILYVLFVVLAIATPIRILNTQFKFLDL